MSANLILPSRGRLVVPEGFDWRRPNYAPILAARAARLQSIRRNPAILPSLLAYYREHPAALINDWSSTYDPRLKTPNVPFVLMPKQIEMVEWLHARWKNQESGLIEKSRDVGASWLAMAFMCAMALLHKGLAFGVGSRKESLLDNNADPSSLFFKARLFVESLPPEFSGGWNSQRTGHSAHMRLMFPSTGSSIVGEAGDQIGRGGRTSMFVVDEAAYIEHPDKIEASLSANTNCRIDLSSVHGSANPFAQKRFSGRIPVFSYHWRDDLRKDDAWYSRKCAELDPVTIAGEYDLNYNASVEGLLIPSEWVQASVNAHLTLGVEVSGLKRGALDVADTGKDLCCFAARHGILLTHCETWSGKSGDLYASTVRAFGLADQLGLEGFHFDSDGLGSGVRGDSRVINATRQENGQRALDVMSYRGSAAPFSPEAQMVENRRNKDFFANAKAMSWWALRLRFQATWRALQGLPYVADDLISIDGNLPELVPLLQELSQPTYSITNAGRVLVDKAPDGLASPNRADSVVVCFHPDMAGVETWRLLVAQGQAEGSVRRR